MWRVAVNGVAVVHTEWWFSNLRENFVSFLQSEHMLSVGSVKTWSREDCELWMNGNFFFWSTYKYARPSVKTSMLVNDTLSAYLENIVFEVFPMKYVLHSAAIIFQQNIFLFSEKIQLSIYLKNQACGSRDIRISESWNGWRCGSL